MYFIYSIELLFSTLIPKYFDGFLPILLTIKNSVAVEIGILPSQSLTNSNFHLLVIEKHARLKQIDRSCGGLY